MPFLLNGSAASIVPAVQKWVDLIMGVDHLGAPIYSSFKEVELEFDGCALASYKQWADLTATGTSLNTITILDQASLNYVAYSGIFLNYRQRPSIESGLVGPWTLVVTNLQV